MVANFLCFKNPMFSRFALVPYRNSLIFRAFSKACKLAQILEACIGNSYHLDQSQILVWFGFPKMYWIFVFKILQSFLTVSPILGKFSKAGKIYEDAARTWGREL